MRIRNMHEVLRGTAFFSEFPEEYLKLIAACGINKVFDAGTSIAEEGDVADQFYLVRAGRLSVEFFVSRRGAMIIDTFQEGEVVGWSWLFPPHRWLFDLKAIERSRVTALDGKCLREKAENDPRLGYFLMKKFSQIMTERLYRTRMRILNIYGDIQGDVNGEFHDPVA